MIKVAFVGAGRMASAMVKGILVNRIAEPADISCTSARDGTAEQLAAATGIRISYDAAKLTEGADWIILACKPQQLDQIDPVLRDGVRGKSVLSILAGTRIQRLRKVFPEAAHIVRAMPNTPGQIGAGVTAYASDTRMAQTKRDEVIALLEALGSVLEVNESQLDAVTGLSGSGPAYVFEFIAALRDAGCAAGLDPETAYQLALKTVSGATALLQQVPETPEQHRDWVSSPGGTTLAGLAIMEKCGFRAIIRDTVLAARDRAIELSS